MKKIFSIFLPLLLLSGGIALAFNTQDEPICSELGHKGYTHIGTPPLPFDPDGSMPSGTTYEGTYGPLNNFICEENPPQACHWVYVPADENNPIAKWVPCSGDIDRLRPVE